MTFKNIKNNGKTFLYRLSCKYKKGSIKVHLIMDDDISTHTHPWNFTSIILFGGYKETSYLPPIDAWCFEKKVYGWLSINKKQMNTEHIVKLRRIFGIKIPTLTIGIYGEKKQLCSLCKKLGYCKSKSIQ